MYLLRGQMAAIQSLEDHLKKNTGDPWEPPSSLPSLHGLLSALHTHLLAFTTSFYYANNSGQPCVSDFRITLSLITSI